MTGWRAGARTRAARVLMAAALAMPCSAVAMAEEPAGMPVRVGDHPGFGRIVFTLPKGGSYESTTEGDRLLLVFKGAGAVEKPGALPRNVVSMQTGPGTATMVLAPGARVRPVRMGDRVVVDVLDPAVRVAPPRSDAVVARAGARPGSADGGPTARGEPAARPTPGRLDAAVERVAPGPAVPAEARPGDGKPAEASLAAIPAQAPGQASGQTSEQRPAAPGEDTRPSEPTAQAAPVVAVHQEPLEPQAGGALTASEHRKDGAAEASPPSPPVPPALATPAAAPHGLVVADASVAAAAFRRGMFGFLVLDRRLDIAAPAIEGARVMQGAVSTTVQVPLAPERSLKVARVPAGWTIEVVDAAPEASLETRVVPDGMLVPFARPGRVVTVLDPSTGGALLVGTSLAAGAEAALGSGRRTPDYVLLPTWLGVAAEPLGDQVNLRAVAAGFLLAGSAADPMRVSRAVEGRRLDLPAENAGALQNRLKAQLASAAEAMPRARTRERLAAVQTMLALGLGPEAQAVVQLVAADDPQAAADAQFQALTGVASVLANRPDEAGGLDDPRLEGSSEVQMWRGLRDRRLGRETAAARALATGVELAWSYPDPLRRSLWPDVAEAAVEGGVAVPVERLPAYAKAMLLERGGKIQEAITAYQAMQDGPDRLDEVRGAIGGTELRLAGGQIGPGQAADVMERQAFAWRGDRREAAIRLRGAALRAAAGGWRAALDSLRETETLFPDQRDAIGAQKAMVFQTMLSADGGAMSPLEVVLLAADYADCVPAGPTGAGLAALLADKLMALDLPARAIPVLQGLVKGAPPGPGRAEFGARLARLLLEGNDAAGAAAALQASDAPALPAALQEARGLLLARTRAGLGDTTGAVEGLVELGGAAADDLRATLLADKGDWAGSLVALQDLAARVVPPTGPLPDAAQDLLVRQASAATQAVDGRALRQLEGFASRLSGARADLFRVLTSAPVTGTTELPRAAKDLTLARAIPSRLQELGGR